MADVVVVDDSQFMRVQIRDLLEKGGHTVIDEASNGNEAVTTVLETEPDVVTMDVKMPGMDGIEAVEHIMERQPTPVLMLSRYTEDGAETTFEALDAGAVDFLRKPGGEVSTGLVQYADELVEKIDVVADANVQSVQSPENASTPTPTPETTDGWENPPTLVIAASTGGPSVVESILGALPDGLGLRVLVVQHMPAQFTDRFAERLDSVSQLHVHEAAENDHVEPGDALVARGGSHLEVREENGSALRVTLTGAEPVHNVRPAADLTLKTVAEVASKPLVGVVVSGMGQDAAAGLKRLSEAGGKVIAQHPETARISGMPSRAIEADAVDDICPPEEIPARIVEHIEG